MVLELRRVIEESAMKDPTGYLQEKIPARWLQVYDGPELLKPRKN